MSPFQLLFVVFLLVPLIEIWLLIEVGGAIGAGWTVFLVVLTAVLGATLVRAQGLSTYGRIQATLARGQMPALEMLEGLALFLAGALLLTPGFFTDMLGFALLVPGVRRAVFRWLRAKVTVTHFQMGPDPRAPRDDSPDDVIDGQFTEVDPSKRPTHRPSGWTKH